MDTNAVNDLPFAFGNTVSYEDMDLLTQNRLKLDRNTERSSISPISIIGNLSEVMKQIKRSLIHLKHSWLIYAKHNASVKVVPVRSCYQSVSYCTVHKT